MTRELKPLLFFALIFALGAGCATSSPSVKKGSKEERAALMVNAAQGSLIEHDPIGAMQYLQAAEDLAPELPSIYHMRALAYQARKMNDAALGEMKKAVALDPHNSYSNNTYGKFLMDAGNLGDAEIYLTRAAEDRTFREAYKARTSLGILHYRKGLFEQAGKDLTLAINDDPSNACIAYYYQGHVFVKQGDLNAATKSYEKASSKLCAAFVDAHYALGLAYEKEHRFDLARKKYLDISQNFPDSTYSEQAIQKLKKIP